MSPMIDTARLILARPSLADFEASYTMNADAAVAAYIGGKPASREEAWNKMLRNIGHWDSFGYGLFTVRAKADGGFVGEVGLAHFSRGLGDAFDPFPEAAWVLAKRRHGQGYATEAIVAAHDWMVATQQTSRTVCIIHPDNMPSLRAAAKLGYARFGEAHYRGSSTVMFERLSS